jgi:abhydrolase domain-containing protein 17
MPASPPRPAGAGGLAKPVRYPGWIDSLARCVVAMGFLGEHRRRRRRRLRVFVSSRARSIHHHHHSHLHTKKNNSKLAFFPPDPPSYALRPPATLADQPTIIPTAPGLPLVRAPMAVRLLPVSSANARAGAHPPHTIVAAHLPPSRPPPPGQSAILILFAHGNAVDLGQMLPFLAELGPALGPGVGVACFDYSGYGASGGAPSASGIVSDGAAALEWAVGELGYPPERVLLYGQSVGSAPAAALGARWRAPADARLAADAARLPASAWVGTKEGSSSAPIPSLLPALGRAGGLALHSPLASGVRVLRPGWTWWPPSLDVFPNAAHVRDVHAPTLVLHGDADDVVAFRCGQDVHAKARTPSAGGPLWVPGGGHCDLEASPAYVRRLRAFVAEVRAHGDGVAAVRDAAAAAVARAGRSGKNSSGEGGGGGSVGCVACARKPRAGVAA